MADVQGTIELRDFLRILRDRRWVIISFLLLIVAATLIWTSLATRIYQATTMVWIEQPSGYTISTDVLKGLGVKTTSEGQIELMSSKPYEDLTKALVILANYCKVDLSKALDSDDVVSLIENDILGSPRIRQLGIIIPPYATPARKEALLLEAARLVSQRMHIGKEVSLYDNFEAEPIKNTDMVEIRFESNDPVRARDAANAITDIYIWKNQTSRKAEAQKTVNFIEERLYGDPNENGRGGMEAQLRAAEQALRDFKHANKIVDIEGETRLRVEQLGRIEAERLQTEAAIRDTEARLAKLNQALGKEERVVISPTIYENPQVQQIKGQLVAAESELVALQAQFTDEHPKVVAAKAKIAKLKDELAGQVETIQSKEYLPNQLHTELAKSVAEATAGILGNQARLEAFRNAEKELEPTLEKLPDLQLQLARRLRNYTLLEKQVTYLKERLEEAKITEAMKIGNARIVELATEPGKQVRPRRGVSLVLAVIFGLMVGVMLAVLMEHLDNTLKGPDEISRALSTPVLGMIPQMEDAISPLIVQHDGRSPVSEAYRTLRSNIKFTSLDRPIQTLLVTSPGAGEGKSTTISNLAISMAHSGKRIILLDTDLRRPTIHKIFDLPNNIGLTNVLVGEARAQDVIQQTEIEGLEVITSGPLPPNPAELLDSPRMRDLVEALQLRCDTVLLDSPPVVVVTDAAILGSTLDGVVLVVESGRVPREVALRAKELLANGKARLLGVVVNKVNIEREGGYYYYYYNRYYGDGKPHRKRRQVIRK